MALNFFFSFQFQLVGILLISVGVYGRAASIVTNLPIISGILACGVILIIISVLGIY
jgi:tetraspanin-13/31